MDIQHWTLFLCLFLTSWVAVFSQRHSVNIGTTCCKGKVMKQPLSQTLFRVLKNYAHLPSHGQCPEYLEFVTFGAEVFCISAGKAQEMKEFVDQRRKGPTPKDTPSTDSRYGAKQQMELGEGIPRPTPSPASAPTSPRGYKEPPTFFSSTTALPGIHGQDRTSTLPSMPPSPASTPTGPRRHTEPPPSSSSTTGVTNSHSSTRTGRRGPRRGDEDQPGAGSSLVGEIPDEHPGSLGEADEATGVDQRLHWGLLAAALVTAAVVLVGFKFKWAPAVMFEGVRYCETHRTPSETV